MWADEVLQSLGGPAPAFDAPDPERRAIYLDLAGRLEQALERVDGIDPLRDVLSGCSVLLHAAAREGIPVLPDITWAPRAPSAKGRSMETSVIGLGELGREVVARLADAAKDAGTFHRFVIELEGTRHQEIDEGALRVVLEGALDGDISPRYGDMLRAAYRAASGAKGLPPLLADSLMTPTATGVTVHVVVGLEDPWIALVPELLFDIRSSLSWGKRGRAVLHILTRPFPRLRGSFRAAVQEIEKKKPFDDVFVISGADDVVAQSAESFIRLGLTVPELLIAPPIESPRGPFASYGIAPAPEGSDETVERYIARLDSAFRAAAPNWVPADAVLGELASEQVLFVHPADLPPPEAAWRLCPEMVPIGIEGASAVIARIQRGLKLADLKLL
jgi:hypothetical protein